MGAFFGAFFGVIAAEMLLSFFDPEGPVFTEIFEDFEDEDDYEED